jgi:hypothetical protein
LSWCVALQSLPEQIAQLMGLTTLNLSWCQALQNLPEQIGQLTGLTTLDLRECNVYVPAIILLMIRSQGVEVKEGEFRWWLTK